jgi:hypothetical protein
MIAIITVDIRKCRICYFGVCESDSEVELYYFKEMGNVRTRRFLIQPLNSVKPKTQIFDFYNAYKLPDKITWRLPVLYTCTVIMQEEEQIENSIKRLIYICLCRDRLTIDGNCQTPE